MVRDPRKHQKKLERQKAKKKTERRELARRQSRGLPARLAEAAQAPILHCCTATELWEVAFVVFLLDIYCLGVKDVVLNIIPRADYDEMYDDYADRGEIDELTLACARKLVEGAVSYALDLGLPPHPDYRTARLIFGDVSVDLCTEEFEYGQDGMPLFVAGPYDDPLRCQQILRALEIHCGPDGYHYILPVGR
jgi:hypothetical protein